MKNYAVLYDETGHVVERAMPEDEPRTEDCFSCTECGQEAWLKWVNEKDLVKKEPAQQEAML